MNRAMRRGFSLIELVIVVVIIGIIAAIAVPRLSRGAGGASDAAVKRNWRALTDAMELFRGEHAGLEISSNGSGGTVGGAAVSSRLTRPSRLNGTPDAAGMYGPYLEDVPLNVHNGLRTIRVDGVAAGASTHGWRLDSATGLIVPDHIVGQAIINETLGVIDNDALQTIIDNNPVGLFGK